MACTWFGEVPSCCSLSLLLGLAWVLLKYVLQTIFSGPDFPAIILKQVCNSLPDLEDIFQKKTFRNPNCEQGPTARIPQICASPPPFLHTLLKLLSSRS